MDVLLIGQDSGETALLSLALKQAGLRAATARDVESVLKTWSQKSADLILVSVRAEDPCPIVKRIRTITIVPLIVIGEGLLEDQRIALLKAGADRIISRPYSPLELVSEIEVLCHRGKSIPLATLPDLKYGELTLDPATRTVKVGTQPANRLTNLEFRLLYTLMVHPDEVLTFDHLIEAIWEHIGGGSREQLYGLVHRLRAKVERDPRHPRYVLSVPDVGYTFGGDEAV